MGMPKGKKFQKGYSSVAKIPGSKGFKEISEEFTKRGIPMGPSNARNILISAMEKIAIPICADYLKDTKGADVTKIAKDPDFQYGIACLIQKGDFEDGK